MGELHASGSAAKPNHIPTLEERVNTLSNQVILLISHFQDSANKSVQMATPDDEVEVFYHLGMKRNEREPEKKRHAYLSLHCLSRLMG